MKENEVRNKFAELENQIKERETSFFRAVKTFLQDFNEFQRDEDKAFPKAAFLGLLFSYLRPRMILVIGGLFAGIFTLAQVYLLYSQNKLLIAQNNLFSAQNTFMEKQTQATEQQAVSMVISRLDVSKPDSTSVAIAELAEMGDTGFDVLLRLSKGTGEFSQVAKTFLLQNYTEFSVPNQIKILDLVLEAFPINPFSGEGMLPSLYYKIYPAGVDWNPRAPSKDQIFATNSVATSYQSWIIRLVKSVNSNESFEKEKHQKSLSLALSKFYFQVETWIGWNRVFSCSDQNCEESLIPFKKIDLMINDICKGTDYYTSSGSLPLIYNTGRVVVPQKFERTLEHDFALYPTIGKKIADEIVVANDRENLDLDLCENLAD